MARRARALAGRPAGRREAGQRRRTSKSIAADLPRLALVALHFPKWVDGRAYSQARLLRSRYRFAGEVRATGEVLVDMLPLLRAPASTPSLLRADQSIDAAERALRFFPGHYQGDVADNRPLFAQAGRHAPSALARAGAGVRATQEPSI